MPFYYFHLNSEPDAISFHAEDLDDAKCEATKLAGQIICDKARTFWDTGDWILTVTDADHLTQFQLQFVGTDAPINLQRTIFASQEEAEIKEFRQASRRGSNSPAG